MRKRVASLMISLPLLLTPNQASKPLADEIDIVRQSLPSEIRNPEVEPNEQVCVTGFPFPSNDSMLIGGYPDGAIQMLAHQEDGTYKRLSLFAPKDIDLTGLSCSLKLVDLDGDGVPEIKFALGGATGLGITDDWYFRWDGTQFINLTPTENGETTLFGTFTADLDLDGKLEVIAMAPQPGNLADSADFDDGEVVYTMTRDGLQKQREITYSRTDSKTPGKPETVTSALDFRTPPSGSFELSIINGTFDGTHRLSSGIVELNGVQIMTSDQVNQNVSKIVKEVQLKQENIIRITMDGPPESRLSIIIEPKVATEPQ